MISTILWYGLKVTFYAILIRFVFRTWKALTNDKFKILSYERFEVFPHSKQYDTRVEIKRQNIIPPCQITEIWWLYNRCNTWHRTPDDGRLSPDDDVRLTYQLNLYISEEERLNKVINEKHS